MPQYRIAQEGYFMGTFCEKDTKIELNKKQAKYPLLSGQLEVLKPVVRVPGGKDTPEKKDAHEAPVKPKEPTGYQDKPRSNERIRDKDGETSGGGKVGGTSGVKV